MKVTSIKFDPNSSLFQGLTEHASNVLQRPNRFTLREIYNPENRPKLDEEDPTIAGISDQFILQHNLSADRYSDNKGISHQLETNDTSWVFSVSLPPAEVTIELIEFLEKETEMELRSIRGNFYYPPTGYMGWHTNSDVPGLRIYVAYAEDNTSYFKWVDRSDPKNPKVVVDYDEIGWNIRAFPISDIPENFLWHCVKTNESARLSYGFMFE